MAPKTRWFSDEMEVMGIAPNIVYGKYQWYINGPAINLCVPMDVPQISKFSKISRYLQKSLISTQLGQQISTDTLRSCNQNSPRTWELHPNPGNCCHVLPRFVRELLSGGEFFLCFSFGGAELGWIPKWCFFGGIGYVFVGHHVRFQIEISKMWTFQ